MTIPYHDTNDFYFSGHICAALIFGNEYLCAGSRVGVITMCLQFCFSAYMMTVLQTHYFIDYTSAIAVSWISIRVAEKVSFFSDRFLIGVRGEKRVQRQWKPCHQCGWSNEYAAKFTDQNEIDAQLEIYRIKQDEGSHSPKSD